MSFILNVCPQRCIGGRRGRSLWVQNFEPLRIRHHPIPMENTGILLRGRALLASAHLPSPPHTHTHRLQLKPGRDTSKPCLRREQLLMSKLIADKENILSPMEVKMEQHVYHLSCRLKDSSLMDSGLLVWKLVCRSRISNWIFTRVIL